MHILAVKPVFCLGVTIYVIGKTGSILGYKRGCFEFLTLVPTRSRQSNLCTIHQLDAINVRNLAIGIQNVKAQKPDVLIVVVIIYVMSVE